MTDDQLKLPIEPDPTPPDTGTSTDHATGVRAALAKFGQRVRDGRHVDVETTGRSRRAFWRRGRGKIERDER